MGGGFRAIAIKPENAIVIFKTLDLVIANYDTIGKDYIVDGFDAAVTYLFYTKEEFDREWRFILGIERDGQFNRVTAR